MRILVTGANGQLGSEMRLLAKNSADEFLFTDVNQVEGQKTVFLDITDRQAVLDMVQTHGIDAIVNCAAWTNVDACETDPELAALAQRLNADAPENLALAMKEAGGLLIHISTDYVFGTEPYNTPCREDQQGTPTGVYGRTKKEGEERILATGCKHVIIRTAWLYSEFGKNFCKTMLQLTAERPTLNVVYDQCGTPTYALDLAKAICTILEDYKTIQTENGKRKAANKREQSNLFELPSGSRLDEVKTENCSVLTENCSSPHNSPPVTGGRAQSAEGVDKNPLTFLPYPKTGIYHYSNLGVCSWYDFTQMIQQTANMLCPSAETRRHCDIRPCLSSQYPSPVKRPSYSVLDKTKIQETFHLDIPYWTDSLRQCIANLIQTER